MKVEAVAARPSGTSPRTLQCRGYLSWQNPLVAMIAPGLGHA